MKKFILLTFITLGTVVVSYAQNADAIIGTWFNKEKDGKIQIRKSGDEYVGKIIWLKTPKENGHEKRDEKNPQENYRNRPIIGLAVLQDFKYDSEGKQWSKGTIYDPKSGKTYSCKLTMKDDHSLNVRGFIGISMIGRTDVWTRTK